MVRPLSLLVSKAVDSKINCAIVHHIFGNLAGFCLVFQASCVPEVVVAAQNLGSRLHHKGVEVGELRIQDLEEIRGGGRKGSKNVGD